MSKRYSIYLCEFDDTVEGRGTPDPSCSTFEQARDCPNEAEHTYGPHGYVNWHSWADKMRRTHNQRACSGCGLFLIVMPKAKRVKASG